MMKKIILAAIPIFLVMLVPYLDYMGYCIDPFNHFIAMEKPFSWWDLTKATWEFYHPHWNSIFIGLFIPAVGYIFYWKKPTKIRYIMPTLFLLLVCYWLINFPLGGQWHIAYLVKYEYPEYFTMLPWWLKFLVNYFPYFGIGH